MKMVNNRHGLATLNLQITSLQSVVTRFLSRMCGKLLDQN